MDLESFSKRCSPARRVVTTTGVIAGVKRLDLGLRVIKFPGKLMPGKTEKLG